jgi:Zn-dependent protease
MRDPLNWSIPLGRFFGITVRVHFLFPLVALGLVLRVAFDEWPAGTWIDMSVVLGLLFLSVLFHEFGHCFAARWVDGDAQEVMIWPLGGLAYVDVPHTPRANLITAAGGPAVNLVLGLACALALILHFDYWPPLNPLNPNSVLRHSADGAVPFSRWSDGVIDPSVTNPLVLFLARLFWVNWALFLVNVVLIGFPLDGGRIFQSILWKYVGYRQATMAAIFAGFLCMFIVALFSIVKTEVLPLCLAVVIYFACKQQWIILETGGEESLFGYDFSQGYTSLERDQPAPPPLRRKQNWFQRWLQRRAQRKVQREQEQREAEERRMDELLEKVQREGLPSLSEEERRFLKRVSDRYRNRH